MPKLTPILAALAVVAASPAFAQRQSQAELAAQSEAQLQAAAQARAQNPNRPGPWWPDDISKKPASWYRTDEGRRIAANILSWQNPVSGGWPLMNPTREANRGDPAQAGPYGANAALIKATVNEIRFMARAFNATGDQRYKDSALKGINFILTAQYPTGGWPHSWPVRDDYTRYATYNDDMMPDLMLLLDEVASSPEFAMAGADVRRRARTAYDRGIDFVLKSQIRVNGQLTAWGQQHDEKTYEPKAARNFEPVAISGGESASVLLMLMRIKNPSPEVVNAIQSGVAWYIRSQINGLELIQADGDRVVRPNPNARPIWARFYQIDTNRPIFAGRDSVIRYSMAEIEKERRGGYAWYNYSGTTVLREYAKWSAKRPR